MELGKMDYFLGMSKLFTKMDKNSMANICRTRKMVKDESNIQIKQYLKDNSKMIWQMDLVKW